MAELVSNYPSRQTRLVQHRRRPVPNPRSTDRPSRLASRDSGQSVPVSASPGWVSWSVGHRFRSEVAVPEVQQRGHTSAMYRVPRCPKWRPALQPHWTACPRRSSWANSCSRCWGHGSAANRPRGSPPG